mmetsp:Transcript_71124/g.169794  ORF Transcript_71124/g.169794 Transcript_71124/m.169794 type:complete len:143 (-) Transcript_71124:56-484(-)
MIIRAGRCCCPQRLDSPTTGNMSFRLFSSDKSEAHPVLFHDSSGAEGFWERRFRRARRKRVQMLQQINAAHDQMRVFYALGRRRLQDKGRLNEEHAAKFARIDERLFGLQRDPLQLEFYDRRKQFHEEYVRKRFLLGKQEEE